MQRSGRSEFLPWLHGPHGVGRQLLPLSLMVLGCPGSQDGQRRREKPLKLCDVLDTVGSTVCWRRIRHEWQRGPPGVCWNNSGNHQSFM